MSPQPDQLTGATSLDVHKYLGSSLIRSANHNQGNHHQGGGNLKPLARSSSLGTPPINNLLPLPLCNCCGGLSQQFVTGLPAGLSSWQANGHHLGLVAVAPNSSSNYNRHRPLGPSRTNCCTSNISDEQLAEATPPGANCRRNLITSHSAEGSNESSSNGSRNPLQGSDIFFGGQLFYPAAPPPWFDVTQSSHAFVTHPLQNVFRGHHLANNVQAIQERANSEETSSVCSMSTKSSGSSSMSSVMSIADEARSVTSEDSSAGDGSGVTILPRVIKPRKRRKKDKNGPKGDEHGQEEDLVKGTGLSASASHFVPTYRDLNHHHHSSSVANEAFARRPSGPWSNTGQFANCNQDLSTAISCEISCSCRDCRSPTSSTSSFVSTCSSSSLNGSHSSNLSSTSSCLLTPPLSPLVGESSSGHLGHRSASGLNCVREESLPPVDVSARLVRNVHGHRELEIKFGNQVREEHSSSSNWNGSGSGEASWPPTKSSERPAELEQFAAAEHFVREHDRLFAEHSTEFEEARELEHITSCLRGLEREFRFNAN